MLDDHARRAVELGGEQPRSGEVVQVVEGERLAAELLDEREQVRARPTLCVVRGCLVRVLPVGQLERAIEGRNESLGEVVATLEPARDRRVVRGRARERDGREPPAQLQRRRPASGPELGEDCVVILRTADGHDGSEALRGGAQERRPPDVDHLDQPALVQLGSVDRKLEGIEVHAHEVEQLDAVLGDDCEVLLELAPSEDARVDVRVERLDAAAEDLRKAGDVLDRRDRESPLGEHGRRAAARHDLEPELGEPARELHDSVLVVDGDQRAHSSLTTFGSSRCSASWTRSRRDSTVSPSTTGTGSLAITGPVSTPSST